MSTPAASRITVSLNYFESMFLIAGGATLLTVGGVLKAKEYYTGVKHIVPHGTKDAASLSVDFGLVAMNEGVKQLAPTVSAVFAIYMLGTKLL